MAKHRPTKRYEVRIPTFDWMQIGGDMNPSQHGGTIAEADGSHIELLKIQPVREYVGEREAAEVGFPFWTREAWYDEADLQTDNEDVISALSYIGVWDNDDQLDFFENKATPEQRALMIAEALLDSGAGADEGEAGWAKDALGDRQVKWWNDKVAGYEYIADEDEEFMTEVLGAISWDHPGTVRDVAAELEGVRDEIAGYDDPEIQETDVRLQVEDGSWTLHSGDAQYDQDHSGYWGASSVSVEDSDETLLETARSLIDEARDAWYEDHPDVPQLEKNVRRNARFGELPAKSTAKVDETAARELELYIENDYALVGAPNSKGKMIEQNLEKKIKQGKYDYSLSVKLWEYLIEDGARKYAKEFASPADWSRMFSPATRRYVAERFAQSFADERQLRQNGYRGDTLSRDDMRTTKSPSFDRLSDDTRRVLKRAATTGRANLTAEQVSELRETGNDSWLMVPGKRGRIVQVAVNLDNKVAYSL